MSPALKSITVTNFRSIRGSVTVPLDAPVVLMYGQNGTGKTSILAAIELALTGRVPSLERFDPHYASHLVHKQADKGRIHATIGGVNGGSKSCQIDVELSRIVGKQLISGAQAHFYNERCYLAQATLGRLLEIYENKDTRRSDSPLTMFVKDLLGLNNLDALIEGLHDAGDIRRLRSALPIYWDVKETISALEKRIIVDTQTLADIAKESETTNALLEAKVDGADLANVQRTTDAEASGFLDTRREDAELRRLSRLRLDTSVALDGLHASDSAVDPVELQNSENASAEANAALQDWRVSTGARLEELFDRLSTFFSDLPSPGSTGPERARCAALSALTTELDRCAALLVRDAEDTETVTALEQDMVRARAREAALSERIAGYSAEAGTLAQTLSAILNHVQSDECPVCGRDFGESSAGSLDAHVSSRIAALTHSADQLQSLVREQADGNRTLLDMGRRREEVGARQLTAPLRVQLKRRRARLEELKGVLTDVEQDAVSGEQKIAAAAAASRRLNKLRTQDQRAISIRKSAEEFARGLDIRSVGETENLASALDRILAEISKREATLNQRQSDRRDVSAVLSERQVLFKRRTAITVAIAESKEQLRRVTTSRDKANARIGEVRELVRRVRETRTDIVRQVFNDSLNAVWRDLFVRLAPDEPFVPAFALPEVQTGPVEAVLETHYRSGGKGGNPRSMLSAGNLNTAALTLFLALHLSVKPMLPWLVIDDPVQSMDEVHISQFAALLRTLSKEHGRQVILAVHEKQLFDYLTLELSPAFQDDRLMTIEIGRSSNGETVLKHEPLIWKMDPAIAA